MVFEVLKKLVRGIKAIQNIITLMNVCDHNGGTYGIYIYITYTINIHFHEFCGRQCCCQILVLHIRILPLII